MAGLECVSADKKCNGQVDCSNARDEDCCTEGYLSCLDGLCINSELQCDGNFDCNNHYDELFCGAEVSLLDGECGDCHELIELYNGLKVCKEVCRQGRGLGPICSIVQIPVLCPSVSSTNTTTTTTTTTAAGNDHNRCCWYNDHNHGCWYNDHDYHNYHHDYNHNYCSSIRKEEETSHSTRPSK